MATEAQRRANQKYDKSHADIRIRISKDDEARIKAYAAAHPEMVPPQASNGTVNPTKRLSLNRLFILAVEEFMLNHK